MAASSGHYAIHRRENNAGKGYARTYVLAVRLVRQGRLVCNRVFCPSTFGGEEAALQAAIAYRDEMLAMHRPMQLRERNQSRRSNNTSGIPGVTRTTDRGRPCYCAHTMLPGGKRLQKRFYIDKVGEAHARELAIAERRQQLAAVSGVLAFDPIALGGPDVPFNDRETAKSVP